MNDSEKMIYKRVFVLTVYSIYIPFIKDHLELIKENCNIQIKLKLMKSDSDYLISDIKIIMLGDREEINLVVDEAKHMIEEINQRANTDIKRYRIEYCIPLKFYLERHELIDNIENRSSVEINVSKLLTWEHDGILKLIFDIEGDSKAADSVKSHIENIFDTDTY